MTPTAPRGSLIGIHAIVPGQTLPLVRQAAADGAPWPLVTILNDAGVCVDVKAASPATRTICRYYNPALDSMQGAGTWSDAQRQTFAKAFLDHIEANASDPQAAATDWFLDTNEEDPPETIPGGGQAYGALAQAFLVLIDECERRNAARRVGGRPELHLGLGCLAQGTPEWAEMVAMVETGLFGRMQAAGHIWVEHEGVYGGDPIDQYYGDLIPGAPVVPGAGAYNFRHRYLYRLLEQRGEVVPLAITEFYDGGGYPGRASDHVARFAWYDRHAAETSYLLGFCGFTIGPDAHWAPISDYTPFYTSPELRAYRLSVKDRQNGVPTMPISPVEKQALADRANSLGTTANSLQSSIAALQAQIAAIVPDAANWWDKLPTGVFSTAMLYPSQPKAYAIYGPDGKALGVAARTNGGQMFERNGDLIRVTAIPPISSLPNWWIRAEEFTNPPVV